MALPADFLTIITSAGRARTIHPVQLQLEKSAEGGGRALHRLVTIRESGLVAGCIVVQDPPASQLLVGERSSAFETAWIRVTSHQGAAAALLFERGGPHKNVSRVEKLASDCEVRFGTEIILPQLGSSCR